MADPIRCCILGVCCVPGSGDQLEALVDYLARDVGKDSPIDRDLLRKMAARLLDEFRLVSK